MVLEIEKVFSKVTVDFTDEIYKEIIGKLQEERGECKEKRSVNFSKEQSYSVSSKRGDAKIKGTAGSGKTLILAYRVINSIKRLEKEGVKNPRILVLTYNITLRAYILGIIEEIYKGNESRVEIKHYHKFIQDKARTYDVGINTNSFNDIEIFSKVDNYIEKYNSIFIDEVQDYEINWQRIIKRYFLEENGEYVLFGDEKQNIYERELDSLKKIKTNVRGNWRSLNKSFRVGGKLGEIAIKFQKEFLRNKYELDMEENLIYDDIFSMDQYIDYKKVRTLEEGIEYIYKIIHLFNKIPKEKIVCLSSRVEEGRNLKYLFEKRFGVKNLISTFEDKEEYDAIAKSSYGNNMKNALNEIRKNRKYNFRVSKETIFSTIHSFKGWETESVIIILSGNKNENNELIYTGLTRSRKNLLVIDISENCIYEKFFKSIS